MNWNNIATLQQYSPQILSYEPVIKHLLEHIVIGILITTFVIGKL